MPGGDIRPALKFATEQLGPRAPTNRKFLGDLEKTMALLMFPSDSLEPELAALLKPDLRLEVADNVNRAILERQSQRRESAIRQLVRMRVWAETTARDKGKSLPECLELEGLELGLNVPGLGRLPSQARNGHDPMITT
jgi:hypothetical protein